LGKQKEMKKVLVYPKYSFLPLFFFLDKKETKNQGQIMRSAICPTHPHEPTED